MRLFCCDREIKMGESVCRCVCSYMRVGLICSQVCSMQYLLGFLVPASAYETWNVSA